jgi:RNA polymerase sigma factor (sigma-70 family)
MDNLTELAREYKKIKSQKVSSALKKKADYVFYEQKFFKNEYKVRIFNRETLKFKNEKRINTFRLCDTKKIELEDIQQELNLKVMELLEKYNISLPFTNYLFGTLKNWRPSYVQDINFVKGLDTINESDLSGNKEIKDTDINDIPAPEQKTEESINLDTLFANLTSQEKMVINILRKDCKKKEDEIAKIIGVTQPRVAQILQSIREKKI